MFVDANVKKETIPAKQNQSVGRNSHGYSVIVIWSVRGKRFCKQVGIRVCCATFLKEEYFLEQLALNY